MVKGLGWTEVGMHRRHGTLDGEWKDVLVVEKLLVRVARTLLAGIRVFKPGR